ncbi:MAG: ABC transporter substrate-binding protein [Rhizobiales bacterium 65-9]|nr:ABC transporter substrate-binding protein [Hyphomicrobiales bacterium]OJY37976.1 MAG: ABC transporter substrate-binding protein [Rhizobiales bacterium 65-9]
MKTMFSRFALAMAAAVAFTAPAMAQKQGGDVVIAMTQAPPSLDPHASSAQVARNVNLHMFETLYARDENAKPVPDLAEGATISPDGLTYVFALRKDVKFHNGKMMGSADVAASLERFRKGGASAALLAAIDSITASGPNEVTVKLKSVQSTFLGNLSSPRSPIAIIPAEEAAKPIGQASPIGTGPFKFVEYKPDSHVKIEKFADYKPNPAYKERDGFAGAKIVYLNSVTFRFIPEAGARNAALESGQVQLNETSDSPTAKRLKDNPAFTVIPVLPFSMQVVKFNHAQAPGSDANFRRAVALAIDPEEIMAVSYPDIYKLDYAWVYGGSAYHSDRGKWKTDIAAAKAELAKSGYKGEKLAYIVDNTRPSVDVATVMQQQLAQIGVNIDIKVADWPTVSKVGFTDEGWNFWTHGFGIEPFEGPASVIAPWVKGVSQRKTDPVIDGLFDKINTEMSVEGQKKIFDQFQDHMSKEAVALNIGNYGLFQIASSKLKNFKAYRIPRMWGVWLD